MYTQADKEAYELRQARIKELQKELAELLAMDNPVVTLDKVKEEAKLIKQKEGPMAATQFFRMKMGCGLKEAFQVVQGL